MKNKVGTTGLNIFSGVPVTAHNKGVLVLDEANLFYFTRYSNADAAILIAGDKRYYICDKRVSEEAEELLENYEITDVGALSYVEKAVELAKASGVAELGYEDERISHREYLTLANSAGCALTPADDEIRALRAVKSEYELECVRSAQAVTDAVFEAILSYIVPGTSERELKAFIDARMAEKGASPAFDTIVAFGADTSRPHAHAGDNRLKDRDVVTVDFGAKKEGYCSDMTRSFVYGGACEEYVNLYEAVLEAQNAALAKLKAGMSGAECHAVVKEILDARGYGEYFTHSLGHSLGVEIHETPALSPRNPLPIPSGALTSVEPGAYIPGKFGVRIEDIVVFEKDRVYNLTKSPKNLIILG